MNLWDIFTMSDSPGQVTDVEIIPFVQSNAFGIDVQVDPTSRAVDGGSMDSGAITIVRPSLSTVIPEGTAVPFSIAFVDPTSPNNELWEQDGLLIQDTLPPEITSHMVLTDPNGMLFASITAMDATTSPEAANFWYSLDGGIQWIVEPLIGMADPFADSMTNTFQKMFMTDARLGQRIHYFFNVQDSVFNQTWFGVGAVSVVPEPACVTLLGLAIVGLSGRPRRTAKQCP